MDLALEKCKRNFTLHIRCSNCIRESVKEIYGGEGGPADVSELIESGLLDRLQFTCVQCDSAIGTIVAITDRSG